MHCTQIAKLALTSRITINELITRIRLLSFCSPFAASLAPIYSQASTRPPRPPRRPPCPGTAPGHFGYPSQSPATPATSATLPKAKSPATPATFHRKQRTRRHQPPSAKLLVHKAPRHPLPS